MTERHAPCRTPHLERLPTATPSRARLPKKRVAIGCSIGATIETYDFIGFGIAAALYFNAVFFPANDPLSGTLLSFATLGIGFAVRPLGGIIGGYLGDKIGRKPVLVGVAAADGRRDRPDRRSCPPTTRSACGPGSCSSPSVSCRAWPSAPSGAGRS